MLTVMCKCLDNSEFISRLLHSLHSRSPIGAFIQKSNNKPSVKLLRDRVSNAILDFSGKLVLS